MPCSSLPSSCRSSPLWYTKLVLLPFSSSSNRSLPRHSDSPARCRFRFPPLSADGGCYRRTDGFRLNFSLLLYRPDGHKKTGFYRQGFLLRLVGSSHYKDIGFLPVHPSSGFCSLLCHRHSKQKRRSAALPEAVPGHHKHRRVPVHYSLR